MKKLIIFSLITGSLNLIAMDGVQPQEHQDEVDPVVAQIQILKALKSREASYHEKNSFLDAYMNPTSFTRISDTHVSFIHHKYSGIFYDLMWDTALAYLAEAAQESNKVMAASNNQNEAAQLLESLPKEPLRKLTEKQKYTLQILFFGGYANNEDLDKKSPVDLGSIILNRANYKSAFSAKDPKRVSECSMTELHGKRFENLTDRIKGLRLMTIMRPMAECTALIGALGGVLGARPTSQDDCIIS